MSSTVDANNESRRIEFISKTYIAARTAFHKTCAHHALKIDSYYCSALGPHEVSLTTDVVRLGSPTASKVLIVISGTHGLEGGAGSLCQTTWLNNYPYLPDDVAVVLIHLLNPWGCAWTRRQTEDNVDLNRNFIDFREPLPENRNYDDVKDALHCPDLKGPSREVAMTRVTQYRREMGVRAYATALFQGQYADPAGIGYGGQTATWSNKTFRRIVKKYAEQASTVALIDLHTGLGLYGHGMLIATSAVGSAGLALACSWYGLDLAAVRERPEAIPYEVRGDLCTAVENMLPEATVVPVALEYGTYEIDRLLSLQIDDCWLMNHGDVCSPQGQAIRTALQEFFYPDDTKWRSMITAHFNEVMAHAIGGIGVLQEDRPNR